MDQIIEKFWTDQTMEKILDELDNEGCFGRGHGETGFLPTQVSVP